MEYFIKQNLSETGDKVFPLSASNISTLSVMKISQHQSQNCERKFASKELSFSKTLENIEDGNSYLPKLNIAVRDVIKF